MSPEMKKASVLAAVMIGGALGYGQYIGHKIKSIPSCVTLTNLMPCSSFFHPTFISDLVVFDQNTRQPITLIDLIHRIGDLPGVAFVRIDGPITKPDRLFLEELSSPMYAEKYSLSKKQFEELQDFCSKKLSEFSSPTAIVNPALKLHWLSIVKGTPPFGLRVQE